MASEEEEMWMSGFYTGTTTKAPTSRSTFTKLKFVKKNTMETLAGSDSLADVIQVWMGYESQSQD